MQLKMWPVEIKTMIYTSHYKCPNTIHNTMHHYIQLTGDIIIFLLDCFEII